MPATNPSSALAPVVVRDLTVSFGRRTVLDGIDLHVARGLRPDPERAPERDLRTSRGSRWLRFPVAFPGARARAVHPALAPFARSSRASRIGAVAARRLVPPEHATRAISLMITGLTLANVIGVPLGTFVAQHAGWRIVLAAIALTLFSIGILAKLGSETVEAIDNASRTKAIAIFLRIGFVSFSISSSVPEGRRRAPTMSRSSSTSGRSTRPFRSASCRGSDSPA